MPPFKAPETAIAQPMADRRPALAAVLLGLRRTCPACGKGHLFAGYLRVAHHCTQCGTEYFHHRADDAPPYFTILIVGHILIPVMITSLSYLHWPTGVHIMVWTTFSIFLSLFLLPRVKGALVALQWALRMHGFDQAVDSMETGPLG